jgi:hypothetical protein
VSARGSVGTRETTEPKMFDRALDSPSDVAIERRNILGFDLGMINEPVSHAVWSLS